ncbi:hypothetical protein [Phototrophicus methaneseepsis]|uniref:hypothetical protein n=1 Tax=Phototrophicus methaneseepsis TaxID=2710758 RepID=UPI001E286FCC|nr:hypothetical protein [Phototrophicus methaneseepsis]
MMSNKHPVIYVAPDMQTVSKFVQLVCSQLTNARLQDQEVVRGLAQFLVFLAQYEAKRRNSQDNTTNDDS